MIDYKKIIDECECLKVRKKSREITQRYNSRFHGLPINITQFHCLLGIACCAGKSLTYQSKELGMDRSTLSRNLRPLERKELIYKMGNHKEARETIYKVSDSGKEVMERAALIWQELQ